MTTRPPAPPWTIASAMQSSYALARDNFAAFFTITLVFGAVSLVIDVLSLGVLAGLVYLLTSIAAQICMTWAAFQAIAGRKPQWEPILRQVQGPLFWRMMLLGSIQYFVIAVSMIVLIGPLFLMPLWAVTVPAMMAERSDIGGAFNRSMDLTTNRRLRILGTFLLWFAIFVVGAVVITRLLGGGALSRLVLWVYTAAAATVLQPLPAIFYVLLREEKEGVAPEQIAAAT